MDTMQVQYLLGASEQGIGAIHADRAARAQERGSAQPLEGRETVVRESGAEIRLGHLPHHPGIPGSPADG